MDGKGKEYNKDGKLIFDGEYALGVKWNGIFKEYDENNVLIKEGEYKEGNQILKNI